MDWNALGAIGELVGAVAVLITVGYLAVQIRQNTRALESGGAELAARRAMCSPNTTKTLQLSHPEIVAERCVDRRGNVFRWWSGSTRS